MSDRILVIGATSAIAKAVMRIYAKEQAEFFLVARDKSRLKSVSEDLLARGANKVGILEQDLMVLESADKVIEAACEALNEIDVALVAHGSLGDQEECEQDLQKTAEILSLNFSSPVIYTLAIAKAMKEQTSGSIVVISSVAGDRGRQSNFIYGSTKAGLSAFMQGLRNRLNPNNIHVLTVKPGFVDTPMTANVKGFLFVSPGKVARDIRKAITKKKSVLYTPFFWRGLWPLLKPSLNQFSNA